MQVVRSHEVNLELEQSQHICLSVQNRFLAEGAVWNLLGNDFWVQRVDVFVLWSQVHGCDSYAVDVLVIQLSVPFDPLQVSVEESYSKEVGAWSTFKGCGYLNHPVYHLCTVISADVVSRKRRCLVTT